MSFGDLNRINTNLQSLDAQFSLNQINKRLGETQLRLSTGLKINKAEDDAAGFSISAKLSSRIAGLEQALQNTGDAKSVLDIAEASFNSVIDILTTLKTKATQAANDTYGTEERSFIQQQINSLLGELDSLVAQTEFQGNSLLDGNFQATMQVGERTADTINITITQDQSAALDSAASFAAGFHTVGLGLRTQGAIDDLDGLLAADPTSIILSVEDTVAGDRTAHVNAQAAMEAIDAAITTVASAVNTLGINQTQLSIREEILTQSINSNNAARSRIQDADFAKEQSDAIKLQILQQTATAALAQANFAPQAVLGFIG